MEGNVLRFTCNKTGSACLDTWTLVSPSQVVATHNFEGAKTVSEFVADGGSNYSLIFANCHLASRKMMKP